MFYSARRNYKGSYETKRYFLYARRSMDDDDHQQLSIPAQVEELKEFAHKENISLADVLVESKTAKEPGRGVFNSMLSRIEGGEAGGILAWHPDRLARNAVDAGHVIHLLDKGLLTDLKFPSFWFQNTSQGLFMLSLAFGQSKYYVDALSENTKRGLRQKIRRGEFPGVAPLGYANDTARKIIIINEKEAPAIKEVFGAYSLGNKTLNDVRIILFKDGLKTSNGNPLHIDRAKDILTNPFYYGHFRYGGEVYEGKHTPLISKKLFDDVQEVLKRRGWKQPQQPRRLPFAGFIKCGYCDMTITGEVQTKNYVRTGRTVDYIYYRCTKKNKKVKCFQPFLTQERLTNILNQLIKKYELRKDWAAKFSRKMEIEKINATQTSSVERSEIKTQLQELEEKLEKLLDAHLEGALTRQEYTSKKEIFMSQKKTLEEKLIALSKDPLPWLEPFREWVKVSQEVPQIVKDNTNLEKKRDFLKYLGSNFILRGEKIDGEGGKQWAARSAAATIRNLVQRVGVEPTWHSFTDCCMTVLPPLDRTSYNYYNNVYRVYKL